MRQVILLFIFVLYQPINNQEIQKPTTGCNETAIIDYLAEIEVTSPETLIEQVVGDVEVYCRRISAQLEKINKYVKKCMMPSSFQLYSSLLKGVRALHKKICNNPEFARRFDVYYPCMQDLRKDLDGCNGVGDWYQEKDDTEVCKNYKHIMDCFYTKIAKVCGINAAKTLKELAIDVIDNVITVKCSRVCDNPDVKDPMPASYLCGKVEAESSIKVITLLFFLRLYLI